MTEHDVFNWLMSPLNKETFTKKVWELVPHIVHRNESTYYNTLFNGADFDKLLEFGRFQANDVRIVRNGKQLSAVDYLNSDGRIDIGRLSEFYLEGYSIVIHSLENFNEPVARFNRAIRQFFSAKVTVNVYQTPKGANALKPHFDSHDVFVVQIEGSKNWRLYESAIRCPLKDSTQPNFNQEDLSKPKEVLLKKGDVMYIPRGWVHDANASLESSLHLTIGVHPIQWVDFISKSIAALSLTYEPLRKSLPIGFLGDCAALEEIQKSFVEYIDVLKNQELSEYAYIIMQDEFINSERPLPVGSFIETLESLDEIGLKSKVEKRPFTSTRAIRSNDKINLQFYNSVVQAPAFYTEAFEFLINHKNSFQVDELPGLNDDSKISLAKKLVKDGLIILLSV